ncbi:conserved hypothetical protein [Candidatus Terasakiella magnetica]|nr:conserved hypothetical protein [Candidatus Terasakiella magnetica]
MSADGLGYSDAKRAAQAAAVQALSDGLGPAAAARATITATDAFFAQVVDALDLKPQVDGLACAAGCAWCCHQIVGITGAEAALLAQAIAALPPERRTILATRTRDAMTRGRGLDQRDWWAARIRCPVLEDNGLCGLHADRPLACRAFNSADADACKRSLLGEAVRTPVLGAQHGIWAHAQAGLAEADGTMAPMALAEVLERILAKA